jgi:hypothetical protein
VDCAYGYFNCLFAEMAVVYVTVSDVEHVVNCIVSDITASDVLYKASVSFLPFVHMHKSLRNKAGLCTAAMCIHGYYASGQWPSVYYLGFLTALVARRRSYMRTIKHLLKTVQAWSIVAIPMPTVINGRIVWTCVHSEPSTPFYNVDTACNVPLPVVEVLGDGTATVDMSSTRCTHVYNMA